MSDRRPEDPELLVMELNHNVSSVDPSKWHTRKATVDEVLAVVRRGVESGTIKGAELTVVEKDGSYGRASMIDQSDAFFVDMDYEVATELPPGTYIVIGPVSDGGSET